MVMKALFGSKKEEIKPQPVKPTLDLNNKEKMKETEREYSKQLQREMREIDRQVLRNMIYKYGIN